MRISSQIEIKGNFVNKGNKFFFKDGRIICKRKGSIVEVKENEVIIHADVTGIDKIYFEIKDNKVKISNIFKDFLGNSIDRGLVKIQKSKGYVPYPFTLLKNVRKAPPGLITTIKTAKESVSHSYKASKELETFSKSKKFYKNNFRKEFEALLRKSFKGKGLVSSFSGGFDSLFLTVIYKDQCKYILHFSEDEKIQISSYKKMWPKIKWIVINNQEAFSDKDKKEYFKAVDEPCCDPSGFAEYLMIKKVANNHKVKQLPVMNGQSCDGIFGNGRKYFQEFVASKLPKLLRLKMPDDYSERNWFYSHIYKYGTDIKRRFIKFYMSNYELDNSKSAEFTDMYECYQNSIVNDSTNFFAALVIMLRYSVYEMEKIKTAARAFNVKYYIPFMSTNIIQYAFSIPAKYKVGFKMGKKVLRKNFSKLIGMEFTSREFMPEQLKKKFTGQKNSKKKYMTYFYENWARNVRKG